MLKKNTRKRLLAGALATVMMLTMCPSWALADDDGIAPLPLVDENRPVAESAPVEADPTETPAVPTPSEPEATPDKDQNTAPAPSDDGASGGTDSTEAGNNNASSDASEDNSQNNSAADSTPDVNDQPQDAADINDVSMASLDAVPYGWNDVQTIEAEYWITNAPATDKNKVNTLPISSDMAGITDEDGIPVTELAPEIRNNIIGYETTVFGHARVLSGRQRQIAYRTDRSTSGTEIDAIRYHDSYRKYFEYHVKGTNNWKRFDNSNDQLVFYYLVRTDYSKMVQIDVSDWAYDDLDPNEVDDTYRNDSTHYSVTYQVIVEETNGTTTPTDSRKFWYNTPLNVSLVAVREINSDYTITHIDLDPSTLGNVQQANGEYKFSLDLSEAERDKATVKIYVKSTKQPRQLTYDKDGGEFTSSGYTVGSVYPKQTIIVPEVEKENYIFDGWFDEETGTKYETGALMPDNDLVLTAHWNAKTPVTPPVNPETKTEAKYFVLLPNRGVPKSGKSQGKESYLPNADSDGGVTGRNAGNGYEGYLTEAGKAIADAKYTGYDATNGYTKIDNVGVESKYLLPPTNLGFFTKANWNGANYTPSTNVTDITALLGEKFNPQIAEVVWYTIKKQSDGYHVDGYVKNVDVTVTYHSNFGDTEQTKICTATTGTNYEALDYADTKLPTRENYTFGGWYTDKNCTTAYETTTLMTSLDLYAKWVPNKFAVSYFVDNVQDGETEEHAVGTDVTVKATPTKTGYTFSGWTPAADVANIIKVADGKFTMPAQDVLFNGTFTINQYRVIYKVDGKDYGDPDVYNFDADVAIRPVPTKEGYTFIGWKIGDKDAENFKMPAHDVEIHGSYSQNTHKYTINKHFYNEKGVEVNVVKGEATPAAENTAVSDLYKADAKNQTVDGKNYVYVPGLTKVTDNLEKLTKDVTIDLHYYLNVEGGNDTPDAWEYRLTFKVVNGEWNDGGNADRVAYVPFKDYKTGKDLEYVVVPATRIPAVGEKPNSGYHAGSWDTTPVGNDKVQKDTVFTYTYAQNSSGGSSGGSHRKPTVTIPDEIPTGLNGDDHYAYIVGDPDKTVRPQNGITRAEVATIFFRLLTDETRNANSTKSNSYSDVAAGAWYNHAVSTLSAMGIVKGDSNGKFNPNASITRAEFAAIAARFDDKANTSAASFSDIANHWAKDEISAAANNGWITGYTDGTFRPNNRITRAEAMALVNRVLKRLPETDEDLHADMIKWSDNSDASQWYYLDVQEATNSHYYQTKENQFEKWTELRDTRDWTELKK